MTKFQQYNQLMFQPNSIRSLLSKRKAQRAQSREDDSQKQQPSLEGGLDPDYQSLIEVKLISKQIELKIESIRQWRQHQKELMEQQLKSNQDLVRELNKAHFEAMEKEKQREEKELKQILDKLNARTEIRIKQNDEIFDSELIFNVLKETDTLRQKLMSEKVEAQGEQGYSKMVTEMDHINDIFKKQPKLQSQSPRQDDKKVDSELLRKQMQQIENQLREIEQLLEDTPK